MLNSEVNQMLKQKLIRCSGISQLDAASSSVVEPEPDPNRSKLIVKIIMRPSLELPLHCKLIISFLICLIFYKSILLKMNFKIKRFSKQSEGNKNGCLTTDQELDPDPEPDLEPLLNVNLDPNPEKKNIYIYYGSTTQNSDPSPPTPPPPSQSAVDFPQRLCCVYLSTGPSCEDHIYFFNIRIGAYLQVSVLSDTGG
jgi:hypothetical protein